MQKGAQDMRIAGIVAEYNPFHNGHAWQIAEAKRRGAAAVFAVMSAGAVQRGALPLLPERVRVRAALEAGADAVLALPAPCACAGAEGFAAAGVRLLTAAGCDTLVCGTETLSAQACFAAAEVLRSPAYTAALRAALEAGARNFASARSAALSALGGPGAALDWLHNPNDLLAVEYAKAIAAEKAGMALLTLPRQGAGHHDPLPGAPGSAAKPETASSGANPQSGPAAAFAGAGSLRALWARAGAEALAPYVPAAALAKYRAAQRQGLDIDPHAFDLALLSRLRAAAGEQDRAGLAAFAAVRGVSEGLEHALVKAARTACTAEALADALTTVRYPRARMRRLALDAALGYTDAVCGLPPYLHILGARRAALPLLGAASLPADTSLARLARLSPECAAFAQAQARAADLAALCRRTPGPMGEAFFCPPVLL
jgi:predicted nucleotidyltransferase